jgi:hypothetical protein
LRRESLGQRLLDPAVERNDTAVGRDGISRQCELVRLLDSRGEGAAAWIRVLDDHRGRNRELAERRAGSIEVVQVVERELAARELLDA